MSFEPDATAATAVADGPPLADLAAPRRDPSAAAETVASDSPRGGRLRRWSAGAWRFAAAAVRRLWQSVCLLVLLSVAASIPVLQLATLGYLLECGGRVARGERWRRCLPGLPLAGRIGTAAVWAALTAVPMLVARDLAASTDLIAAGSPPARFWRVAALVAGLLWSVNLWWAMLRGGRWYHFLWPAPVRFCREFFRGRTWLAASDTLADAVGGLQLLHLLRLGFFGALGCLLYLAIPGGLMIAGIRADGGGGARGLFTLLGLLPMLVVLQYVPFLQLRYAKENRFAAFADIAAVRAGFRRAPWLHAVAVVWLVAASLPLYLLRIERPPDQLIWLVCVFFVLFSLPTKLLVGWAVRYADGRERQRSWYNRWPAWLLQLAAWPVYIVFLYLASLASWDGSAVIVVQHAFLVPVPFLP